MKVLWLGLPFVWLFLAFSCIQRPEKEEQIAKPAKEADVVVMVTDQEVSAIATEAFEAWSVNRNDGATRRKLIALYDVLSDSMRICGKTYTAGAFDRILDVKIQYLDANLLSGGTTIDHPDRQLMDFEELIGNRAVKDIKLTLQDGEWKIKEVIFAAPERRG